MTRGLTIIYCIGVRAEGTGVACSG